MLGVTGDPTGGFWYICAGRGGVSWVQIWTRRSLPALSILLNTQFPPRQESADGTWFTAGPGGCSAPETRRVLQSVPWQTPGVSLYKYLLLLEMGQAGAINS